MNNFLFVSSVYTDTSAFGALDTVGSVAGRAAGL